MTHGQIWDFGYHGGLSEPLYQPTPRRPPTTSTMSERQGEGPRRYIPF